MTEEPQQPTQIEQANNSLDNVATRPSQQLPRLSDIKIKSGPVDVLNSGTVIAFSNNPLQLTMGSPIPFVLTVVFEEEEGNKDTRIDFKVIDLYSSQLTCFNFKKQYFPVGNVEPLPIATINGARRLYMQFRVSTLSGGDVTFNYTFYAGESVSHEVTNG